MVHATNDSFESAIKDVVDRQFSETAKVAKIPGDAPSGGTFSVEVSVLDVTGNSSTRKERVMVQAERRNGKWVARAP